MHHVVRSSRRGGCVRLPVVLSIAKLSAGQERYYLDQAPDRVDAAGSLAGGAEDYYLDPGEARGRWFGAGAARLGLQRDVGAGEPLRTSGGAVRVAAFDLTFSAPKSVSVVFGVGDEDLAHAVRRAHDRAVREALGYLERSAIAVRRGRGGKIVLPARGMVAAVFRHRTSRAGDPQLHSHVVIANLGLGPDGRWSALDGRRLCQHKRTASRLYQAVLRGELSRSLGVGWGEVRDGIAEIEGVPPEVLRAFSRRRAEIETAMTKRGTVGPRAAEAAALATRRRKDRDVDATQLQFEWRRRAAELGRHAVDLRSGLARGAVPALDEDAWLRVAGSLGGPEGLTRDRSSFDRADVLQAICERLPAGTRVDVATVSDSPTNSSPRRSSCRWSATAARSRWSGRSVAATAARSHSPAPSTVNHGRLVTADSPDAIRERLVADWSNNPAKQRALMIAHRRVDVADLNRRARDRMRQAGRLHGEELVLPGARYAAGDQVVIRRNEPASGVHNGDLARVVAVDQQRLAMEIELDTDERRVVLGAKFLLRRTEHGERSVTHGYAVTAHVAQGITVDRTFVLAGPGLSREWAYAAMSRGREANHLYAAAAPSHADRAEYAPTETRQLTPSARDEIARALESSRAQTLGLERARGIEL